MKYPATITLFMEPLPPSRRPSAFVVSGVAHVAAIVLIALGVFRMPVVNVRIPDQRYTLRIVKLQESAAQRLLSSQGSAYYPDKQSVAQTPAPGGERALAQSAPAHAIQKLHAPQTLIQPELPQDLLLAKKIPIPQMMLWSAKPNQLEKVVMAPIMKPLNASVRPVIEKPNNEERIADVKLSSSVMLKESPTLLASSTSPIVMKAAEPVQQVPQMISASSQASPTVKVLSISDLRMTNGSVPLPRVNESAHESALGQPTDGAKGERSQAGKGKATGVDGTPGSGAGAGAPGKLQAAGGSTASKGVSSETSQGDDTGSGRGNRPPYQHVVLPRDGQFGVVVVGSSIAESYPETQELWSGRMASTVYVHVGLAKSWILQYSQPENPDGAAAGNSARIEAPWPYDITRPTLAAGDLDADALMVHGFVNKEGKFETLAVVFPPQFAREKFVLDALNQWRFRPAMQNRQTTPVEILLVIPDEYN